MSKGSGRTGIVAQTVMLTSAIAAIAVLVAGAIAYPLTRSAAESQQRVELARLADLTATALDRGITERRREGEPLPRRLIESLERAQVVGYVVADSGAPVPGVSSEALVDVLEGESVSEVGEVESGPVLVEGRGLLNGNALILQQPATVAGVEAGETIRRIALALLIGLLIAVPVGFWAARRLTRPLRAARDAAHAMSTGSRDVELRPEGPAEIADISEALTQLNGALVTSEGRQREFLLSVSHELRTPLTAVKGYAEALSDGIVPDAEVPSAGATISAEAARLDRLVTDLLDLARLGAVDFRMSPVDVDICQVAEDARVVWERRCETESVAFVLERPGHDVIIRTDPIRVRQIIDNLVENALRVSPPGTRISLQIQDLGSIVDLQVRDQGPGLSADDIAVAFEPGVLHERYRGVRPVGTGLGLALVGRLATGLGGTAKAAQAVGGGACFSVQLPRT